MSDYPVPAAPMARRVAALLEAGMTRHAIAKRVGVDHRIINDLAAGKKYVYRSTAERFYALLRPRPPLVCGIGAHRRVAALVFMGWSLDDIAAMTGADAAALLFRPHLWQQVNRDVHESVARVFARLEMTPGPCDETRRWARRAGYVSPLAWDEDQLDDPEAAPNVTGEPSEDDSVDHAAVVRRMQGERVRVNRAEAAAVVARLRRHGLTDRQIYLLTRIKVDRYAPLQRDLQRQGVAA